MAQISRYVMHFIIFLCANYNDLVELYELFFTMQTLFDI